MEGILKGLGAIIVTVIGGLAVWWLTASPDSPIGPKNVPQSNPPSVAPTSIPETAAPTAEPQSFSERLAGDYELDSWNRAQEPIDLAVGVKDGTLQIDLAGNADWDLSIWDRAANPGTPDVAPSRITCGGRVSSEAQQIIWVPGGDRNSAIDWEPRLDGLYTEVFTTLCGGQSSGTSAPFGLSLDEQSNGNVFLEMSNSEGTFRWVKAD